MKKLTPFVKYPVHALKCVGWADNSAIDNGVASEDATEGMNYTDFFDQDGTYLGPDKNAIEPVFETANPFGSLMSYSSGEYIRPATEEEQEASIEAGETGVIERMIDGEQKLVWVED
jgi:hypothetical protein